MLKSWKELREIDVTPYCDTRDGMSYLNWAKCVDLLHQNGAEQVYFEPLVNEKGSSLFMTDQVYTDSKGNSNRCYEIGVIVHVDDNVWEFRSPLMNGSNPVKDNSMSQQRIWNAQTRAFVKCVAMHTGLGFNLWVKDEMKEEKDIIDDDLTKHDLFKIKERCQEIYTKLIKAGLTAKEIAGKLNKTEEEVKAIFSYFDIINNFEREMSNIDTKQR